MYTINDQISQLIDEEFQQGNITEWKLCLGICSRTSLRNFRDGSTITDFNIVQILLQRMGKSANKLEVVTSRDIMEKYIRQLDFDKSLDEDNSLRAKELLELFRIEAEELNKSNVSILFYFRNCAAYYQYIETDYKRALELIKTANELTLPEYKHNKLTEYLISTIELENLLAECLYTYYVYNDNYALIAVRERLNEIYVYMNTHVTDEEEISAILPKYMMVSAYLYAAGKEYDRAVRDAEKGLERLRDSMLVQNALPLLDIIVKYGANCELLEPYKNYVDYYNALSGLTEEMGASNYKYDSLFVRCRRNVFHDDAMLIKAQRIINKKSQQEIADGISVDPYVISTYESGKHSPNKSTYPKLMTALGLKVGRQSTLLIDKSFKSSEILYSINNMIIPLLQELLKPVQIKSLD